jgi:hypothetical protein
LGCAGSAALDAQPSREAPRTPRAQEAVIAIGLIVQGPGVTPEEYRQGLDQVCPEHYPPPGMHDHAAGAGNASCRVTTTSRGRAVSPRKHVVLQLEVQRVAASLTSVPFLRRAIHDEPTQGPAAE